MDAPSSPSQLVALNDGTYFVSGTQTGDKTGKGAGLPINAIYNGSGKLVRKVSLKDDAEPKGLPKITGQPSEANPAVRFGRAVLGEDGNIYLIRAVSPTLVYVISPGGDLVRTVKVSAPFDKAVPIALMINAGRIAIEFSDPNAYDMSDTTIRVADALTGTKIADYQIALDLTEAVACYSGNRFTFLGNSRGWPAIMQANAP